MKLESISCCGCGCDIKPLVKDKNYDWICHDCLQEFEIIDRETDWDDFEAKKRARIAEANEY
jgi:hypothetical protein